MTKISTFLSWALLLIMAAVAFHAAPAMAADAISTSDPAMPLMFAAGFINIRGLFTQDALIRYLKSLPILTTPVMDTIYTNRPQHPLAMIGDDVLKAVVKAMPLARRGGRSISIGGGTGSTNFYEPFPIHPDVMVTGTDLNNLKILQGNQAGLDAWATAKTDFLRRTVRATTEALAAVSLTGKLEWPVQLEGGGFETYTVDFGLILSVEPSKLWDAADAKTVDVFELLSDMQLKIQQKGYGGAIEVWAGRKAYNALYKICEKSTSTAKIRIEITDQGINVGGFLIKRRIEQIWNPQTKGYSPVVADEVVKMIAMDAGHQMPYCAIDDLDGNLQPMPFFVKPIKTDNPSGYQLVAESKPFPIPNVDGICDATVVA